MDGWVDARHKRTKGKRRKRFTVETRYVGPHSPESWWRPNRMWHSWSKYETDRGANDAVKQLTGSWQNYEFRRGSDL